MSRKSSLSSPSSNSSLRDKALPMMPSPSGKPGFLLPTTRQDSRNQITCYDYLGKPRTHDDEQRYVSPTTDACRRLIVQAVNPSGLNEKHITDHTSRASKVALWLSTTNPFLQFAFFQWFGAWLFLVFWLWPLIPLFIYLWRGLSDKELYKTGNYKSYIRSFRRQFWAARSPKEHSTRTKGKKGPDIPTRSLRPRLLMIREPTRDHWSPCKDPVTITRTKFVAISYCSADMNLHGPKGEKDFVQEVRSAVVQQNFDAYWLDLECLGKTPEEKKLDVYRMADVYRGADITLIMLGDAPGDAWKRWGGRVWTLPEALLSKCLYYKFRGRCGVYHISLHQLGNLAYKKYDSEQAIINAYSGKDPLERLERLTLLKSAIWRRDITGPSTPSIPSVILSTGPYPADRVYALMGFFEHRVQPDYSEDDLRALARLSMANDNDRIVERMVSLLPTKIRTTSCWYADDDVYAANLWDVVPEIQVAGITESGALVLNGCRAACIRWKDFPAIAHKQSGSVRRVLAKIICYLAWPCFIFGTIVSTAQRESGIMLVVIGCIVFALSPWLFVFSEGGRRSNAQPWLIGVKGVLDLDKAAMHLYGGGVKGRYSRLNYTPSGSGFSVPEEGLYRRGARTQYELALAAERGPRAGKTYTLIDTRSSTIYYFCAERPPTVCLFTGREGGLGRFVLCSERCAADELHKETVLRMPTYISQRMELCDWVALG